MTSKKNNEHIEPEKKQETQTVVVENEKAESEETKQPEDKLDGSVSNVAQNDETQAEHQEQIEKAEKQGKRGVKLGVIAIAISIIFSGGIAFQMQQKSAEYSAEIAALQVELKNTQSAVNKDLQTIKQETIQEASHAVEKTQVVQSQQQKSIQSLQLAVADVKGRRPNDWLLAEADYLVKLAGRKLFLEHDAVSATKLMESADQRIAALNDPSLVSLRQSMTNDITKLRTIPLIDRDGLVLRITSLQQQVDHLPLANAILPEAAVVEKKAVSGDINDWQNNLMTSMKDFSENFITFRSRDGEVIPLLSPEQHFYLRENIKGKLETAIRAVYKEQGDVYNAALKTANEWSTAYLNQDNQSVIEFEKAIKQLSEQNISVKYPVKLESQNELSDVIRERLRREMTVMTTEEK
ncbi:uroporphyrinogen-III C-methyltransferase [Vibrio cyclitrophicus]|uniref:Uroporphyrinogen-III C-methyltransferase n=1 Tax=Vibrio cyclitrophicus ZF270 TaxID=1136176 RepID=A0AAN0LTI1_9VIBR|nr:uroporphyrinogen-III C-methyltransferase [Vibrio cyclitrophicus]ERM59775.1 Uroporphyrinogen-III methyltransferase [Vibrio cyclitrophicus FF75]OCH44827.1 heme biosynthesis operon protein HemX [Vibrio cyclitrophicus]OED65804.1 heme biosynthesis operon protein HemX [Vibrio cyclitrophicus ZF99]OEE05420.1 heme biosynthesis operon protein HemX [Vibrio cyclitrophicus ZF270]OEE47723.1 heme biosynthesis operon protein HemX [Vibrio cyclitrophicus FF75]